MLNMMPSMLEAVLTKYSNLFRHKLGTIREITAKLHDSPGAQPHFYLSCSVPYALRSRVDQTLEKLVSDGILEVVLFSEWAAPIVRVVKRDSSIRVCGDYKLTINKLLKWTHTLFPLSESIAR